MKINLTHRELYQRFPYLTVALVRHLRAGGQIIRVKQNLYEVDLAFMQAFDAEEFWKQRKEQARQKRSISQSNFQQSRTDEEKQVFKQNCSKAVTKVWAEYDEESRKLRIDKSNAAISVAMKTPEARQHCREGQLKWWSKAPKDWNEKRIAKIKTTIHKTYTPEKRQEVSIARKEAYKRYNGAIQEKRNATKRKNGTFTTSKDEIRFMQSLLSLGLVENDTVFREYYYPGTRKRCDFYIPMFDLYIELQYAQYHMHEPFDETNLSHIQLLQQLRLKSADLHTRNPHRKYNQYDKMISVWTESDVSKRLYAESLNLNVEYIYTYEQEQKFLLELTQNFNKRR